MTRNQKAEDRIYGSVKRQTKYCSRNGREGGLLMGVFTTHNMHTMCKVVRLRDECFVSVSSLLLLFLLCPSQ